MVTILAFGHNYNFYIGIKEDIGKTHGGFDVGVAMTVLAAGLTKE